MKSLTGEDIIALVAIVFFFGFVCGYCVNCMADANKQLRIVKGDDV